jgi:hypothetical protein
VVRPFRSLALGALACALIAGCGSSGGGSSTSGAPPTSTSQPDQGNVLVDFGVTGGIGGIDQELVVYQDGSAKVTTRTRASSTTRKLDLSHEELSNMRDDLVAANLGDLPTPPPSGCSDCFIYRLAYLDTTYETDQISVPKPLRPAIADLTKLVAVAGAAGDAPSISGK